MIDRRRFVNTLTAAGAAVLMNRLTGLPGHVAVPASAKLSQEQAPTPYVIGAPELASLIASEPAEIRIIDVSPLRRYRDGHIAGAVHGFWEDTVDRNYPHFGAVITQGEEQQQRLDYVRRLGIDPETRVVAYDDFAGFRASRIVWFLRFLGFERVSLLDGGLRAWQDAGQPVDAGVTAAPRENNPRVEPREGYYLVTRQLIDRLEAGSSIIVDCRTDAERQEDHDGVLRRGTIPGSLRLPWDTLIDRPEQRLVDVARLESAIVSAGVSGDREVVLFGLYGVDAALPWLALKHAVRSNVVSYDRGWVEWASRPDLPVAPL